STAQLRGIALKHLVEGGKALGVGQSDKPLSLYNNPQLYPQIFPWLFPYGLGGIGNINGVHRVSDTRRIRDLLLYHDKRFQQEPMFPLIALNHQQIKASGLGGFLVAKQANFKSITERLHKVDMSVLNSLIDRLSKGEHITAKSEMENNCYQVIKDLDYVAGNVPGSKTSRKMMRNEIWSLISYLGAPSWFITFSPSDVSHPIALYYAGNKTAIYPTFYSQNDRVRLIANNPVAGAKFFNLMVKLFIKHVLGIDAGHDGLYGKTAGYYGTVEQ
ncbi:hypothetical protein FA95DRAFT_1476247, partial [Auriscalpium vulgare]